MPYQPMDYSRYFQAGRQDPDQGRFGGEELLGGIERGMKLGSMPGRLMREREAAEIANKIKGVEAKYAEPQALADLNKKKADAIYRQLEAQYYPESTQSTIDYKNALIRNSGVPGGGKRYAPTNLGKLYQEREQAIQEYGPDSQKVKDYDLVIQRGKSDADTRKRNLFASNLEKSMAAINPNDITRYSGPQGALKLKKEQAMDLAGKPSEEYLKYKEALVASEFETSELRQFFGDSITPEVRRHLNVLSNPASLMLSPTAARKQIEKSRSIIKKQLETYRGAIKGTEAYSGEGEDNGYADGPSQNGPSESDIEFTARKYGMSPDQVRQKLGM